jgi:hypothetical protein
MVSGFDFFGLNKEVVMLLMTKASIPRDRLMDFLDYLFFQDNIELLRLFVKSRVASEDPRNLWDVKRAVRLACNWRRIDVVKELVGYCPPEVFDLEEFCSVISFTSDLNFFKSSPSSEKFDLFFESNKELVNAWAGNKLW